MSMLELEYKDIKMGFKPTCCWGLGLFSFIGAIFFCVNACMVHRRNWVFLSHKAGMDMFQSTDEELQTKMVQMLITAGVRKVLTHQLDILDLGNAWLNATLLLMQLLHQKSRRCLREKRSRGSKA